MWFAQNKKVAFGLTTVAILTVALILVFHNSRENQDSVRTRLLRFVPDHATSVVFVDLDQLRASPFLRTFYSWAPHPAEDSDYMQFLSDTGFNYERDLSQVFIAISNRAGSSRTLVLADGKFDRKKIEAFLNRNSQPAKQGNLAVFLAPAKAGKRPASFAFLSDHSVAIANSEDLQQLLSAHIAEPGRTEWQTRFDRMAGSPIFAVIRQDPTIQNAVAYQSPELAAFIAQLPWVTVAARPEADSLQVVAEGETITDTASSQLRDFLQGIRLLAEGGLNDPKLRQQLNPDERAAYLGVLKRTEIEKISRGEVKSVRIVLPITEELLKIAKLPAALAPSSAADPPPVAEGHKHASNRAKSSRRE